MSNFSQYCNICTSHIDKFSPYGKTNRSNALCPKCTSLERHRLFKSWFDLFKRKLPIGSKILHFAPEEFLIKHFVDISKENYLSVDIKLGRAMKVENIINLSFANDSFDFIFCSHVLHHIQNDDVAIKELHRVLKNEGTLALINSTTSGKTKEVQYSYFKRVYNNTELKDKLTSFGFDTQLISGGDLVPDKAEAFRMGISQPQLLFICTKNKR